MNSVWKIYWNSLWTTFPSFLMDHMVKAFISWIQATASVAFPLHNLSQTPIFLYKHHLLLKLLNFLFTSTPTRFTGWFELGFFGFFFFHNSSLCLAGMFSMQYRGFLASQKVHEWEDELRTIKSGWDEDAWHWMGFTPGKWLTPAKKHPLSV